jgi:hypothetical protein
MVGLGFIVYSPLLSNTYSTRVENKQLWKILNTTPPWSHLCSSSIIILYQFLPILPSIHPQPITPKKYQLLWKLACFQSIMIATKYVFLCIVPKLIALKNPIIILDLHQLWAPIWASLLANRPNRPKPTSWVGLSSPRPPSSPQALWWLCIFLALYTILVGSFNSLARPPSQNA